MQSEIMDYTTVAEAAKNNQSSQKISLPNLTKTKLCIVGLGYVGLPLTVAFARHFSVVGFDIDETRIQELNEGFDRTGEIASGILKQSKITLTHQLESIKGQEVYIVTVPTPVNSDNLPDLGPLERASKSIGKILQKGAIVVYESTVYPGVTEEFCGPILEQASGLKAGQDFFLGYSPERINPGDKEHTVDKITKVVAGQTPAVTQLLANLYGTLNQDNIFQAKNIKTAEAAKVIENTQRDINIAFINEIATIVGKLGLSIYEVLEAASTKWNFLNFQPGLVGGHCIGVDPYYLAYCSRKLDHEPEVILAGRRTNENMGPFIANAIHQTWLNLPAARKTQTPRVLILGLTFKENIPDLRNTKVLDVYHQLIKLGYEVDVHDCCADPYEAKLHCKIELKPSLEGLEAYDCLIGAVPHREYCSFTVQDIKMLLKEEGLIADIKNMWRTLAFPNPLHYWSL